MPNPYKLNLQYFADGNPPEPPKNGDSVQPPQTPPEPANKQSGVNTNPQVPNAGTGNSEPLKTPSADEIRANVLKELGVTDLETAKNSLKQFNEYQEKNKTELQKAQDQTKSIQDQLAQAQKNNAILNTKNVALGKGVRADALDDVVKLVSGEKDVNKALDGILKKYPQFGAQQEQQKQAFGQRNYQSLGGANDQDEFVKALNLRRPATKK